MQIEKQGLTKKEKALMRVIYQEAEKREGLCLLSPVEILERIPYELDYKETEIEPMLRVLEVDDYLDKVNSDKKGELIYCITMHKKGMAFKRREDVFKRSIYFKIGLTIVFSTFGALVGLLIKYLIGVVFG